MSERTVSADENQSLYCFQINQLFEMGDVETLLNQPQWEAQYPELIRAWRSIDKIISSRVLLPGTIVHAIAQSCTCVGDFFADPDGQTLHIVKRGKRPTKFYLDGNKKMVVEEIVGATELSVEQAVADYGADAVWLAQEYGKSRRGERDNRFKNIENNSSSAQQ